MDQGEGTSPSEEDPLSTASLPRGSQKKADDKCGHLCVRVCAHICRGRYMCTVCACMCGVCVCVCMGTHVPHELCVRGYIY